MQLQVKSLSEQLLLHEMNLVEIRATSGGKCANDVVGLAPRPIWRADELMPFDFISVQNQEEQRDVFRRGSQCSFPQKWDECLFRK